MRNRFLKVALATVLAAVIGVVLVCPEPVAAQSVSAKLRAKEVTKDEAWTPPRTPDGQPDIQGIFTNASVVPLERPKDLGSREFFTKAEADTYTAKVLSQREVVAPGTYGDVHYNKAQFGLEKGQTKVPEAIRTSLIVGPEGRVPPLLPAAKARAAAKAAAIEGHEFDSAEDRPLAEQCILWPNEGPPMLPEGYNSNLQIVQGKGYVAIMQEMIHDVRIIPTDGQPHLPPEIRLLQGDSRGHWDGDTFVVDTTNFTDRTAFRDSTGNLHVVERFTRTGPDTVLYQFTVEDPSTWEKSWSGEVPMTRIDGPIFEYACHEGNYGMPNNLSGARAAEIQAAQRK